MNSGVRHGTMNGKGNGRREDKSEKWQDVISIVATSFIWVAGDGTMIHFPRKKITFCFNRPCNLDADARSRGVGSSKDFETRGILEKEPRSVERTSYQADRHGYLPEVKIESSERMPDRVNNNSGRSAVTKKLGSNQRLAEDLI
jgi:hypothetical protein